MLTPGLTGYVVLEPSVQWARLPESIWWSGHAMQVGAGEDPQSGMPTSGSVKSAFIGGAIGFELRGM